MTTILVAADARWVRELRSARRSSAPARRSSRSPAGQDVRDRRSTEHEPDLVILDMQIGNMGGIAVAIDLRLEESARPAARRPTILLLLDREADRFLGRRADVDATLVKPVDAGTLRRAAKELVGTGAKAAST